MTVHPCKNYREVSKVAAEWLMERVRKNPKSKIGIATGNSPLGMYRHITHTAGLNTQSLSLFQLDEWVGVTDLSNSCMSYIEKEVRVPWGIPADRTHYFSPDLSLLVNKHKAEAASRSMQKILATKGPLDVLILGMGQNGHLGFIEPGKAWSAEACYVSELSPSTQLHSMVEYEKEPPAFGVTLGIKSILEAKEILFIVTGNGKSEVYSKWLSKEVSPELPASILWKHPSVFTVTDL